MATISNTIELIFKGNNLLGPTLKGLDKDVKSFRDTVDGVAKPIAAATTGLLAMEAAALKMAFTFGKDAFNASVDFSRAQTELNKVLADSEGSAKDYTAQILDLSNTYGVSATQTLDALATWKQAGFTAKEAGELTEQALRLVIAGGVDADRATNLLVRSIKGFNLTVGETPEFLDTLNAITNNYGVSLDQLGEGMSRIAPISEILGTSYEEMAGFLTPVIEQTQNAEIASRGLRTTFLRFASPTKDMVSVLDNLGIALQDANGEMRPMIDVIKDVGNAFEFMTDEQRASTAAMLAGKDQAAVFATLVTNMGKAAEVTAVGLAGVGTSIDKEVTERFKSAGIIIDRTAVAFENLKILLGTQYQTALAGVIDGFGEIFRQLQLIIASGGLDKFFDAINPQLGRVEQFARDLAQVLPEALAAADYSGFSNAFESIVDLFVSGEVTAASVAATITTLGNTFDALTNFTVGVINAIVVFANLLSPTITLFNSLGSTVQTVVGIIGGASLIWITFGGAIATSVVIFQKLAPLLAATRIGIAVTMLATTALSGSFAAAAVAAAPFIAAASAIALAVTFAVREIGELLQHFGFLEGIDFERFSISGGFDALLSLMGRTGDETEAASAKIADGVAKIAQETESLGITVEAANDPLAGLGVGIESINASLKSSAIATVDLATQNKGWSKDLLALTGDVKAFGKVADVTYPAIGAAANDAAKKQAEAAKKTVEETEKVRLKMLELASDERIALIEATVKINTAQIDADVRKIEAAFSSIDNTVSSTGDLIGSLFGQLNNFGRFDQLAIFDQIAREDRRRQEALDLQKELVEAQIDRIKAQTRAISEGQPLINIDASPLAPHLQSLWREVLEQAQVELSADMVEMLLNLNPDLNVSEAA